jgi:K(+)-stimulated pyrophosphate-energized sodium pump
MAIDFGILPWVSVPVALVFAIYLAITIRRREVENERVREIESLIKNGAMTYLNKQYRVLIVFIAGVSLVLAVLIGWKSLVSFLLGAFFSALTGNIGMRIATMANSRTAEGCKEDINTGLKTAFSSGSVMGLTVVGIGLIGVTVLYAAFEDPEILYSFGFGASSIALFARVGGGIYTKAADVGADLVGKIEAGIPEDDPRNPAVIADNVGDNVGDVAGMGADLFESYVDSIIAAMAIGVISVTLGSDAVILPMAVAALGILASVAGNFFVRASGENLHGALNRGIFASAGLMLVASYFLISSILDNNEFGIWIATASGLVAGIVIGLSTQYYTSESNKPTQSIADASRTGAATNIIAGLATGMKSTTIPILAIVVAIIVSYHHGELFGISMAAVGMLSTLGITLATDTYGPVADNAAGIAEMAELGQDVRERAEALDAVGNTTAAIGKGFAIGSAALTALALFSAYNSTIGVESISLNDPFVISGLFIGALLPFLFSAFTMSAVGSAAAQMVEEVRRQFKTISGIMEGEAKPDYERCISISTSAALREMILPGLMAVIVPVAVGLLLGPEALGGLLAGATATGFLMALMMANAGGAWDNAKKFIERGNLGGKGSDAHKAAVTGDTVGDPFKDTSGPSLNILIKLMSIVALTFIPLFPGI